MPSAPFLLTVFLPFFAGQVMIGTPAVYDGDTFAFGDDVVRLFGIDAPERRQTCQRQGEPWDCGEAAKLRLQELLSYAACNVSSATATGMTAPLQLAAPGDATLA